MNHSQYKASWRKALGESTTKNYVIAGLLCVLIILSYTLATVDRTVVVLPPNLTEEVSVSNNKASASYKKAWGIHVASLLGNITPGTADFVLESMGRLFEPLAYANMESALMDQLRDIKNDSITVRFEPQRVDYEPESDKVFVFGKFTTVGGAGKAKQYQRTYEMQFVMRRGQIWATSFTPYEGLPRTMEFLQGQPEEVASAAK